MPDLGAPISYMVLDAGTPVVASDGAQVGEVTHVLAVPEKDVFDGIVIDVRSGPGGHRFVDADQVAAIHERGVTLTLDSGECRRLPEPSANPAALGDDPAWGSTGDVVRDKLRRAWDLISGRY